MHTYHLVRVQPAPETADRPLLMQVEAAAYGIADAIAAIPGDHDDVEPIAAYHRSGAAFAISCYEDAEPEPLAPFVAALRAQIEQSLRTEIPDPTRGMRSWELSGIAEATADKEEAERVFAACGGDLGAFDPFLHEFCPERWGNTDGITHYEEGDWLILVDIHS